MQKRISQGELCSLVGDETRGAGLPAADMEMGYMNFVTRCQFLKDIVVPGRYGVVDIILSGDKEDLHMSHVSRTSTFPQIKRLFWI
jgi:hypothetical protein